MTYRLLFALVLLLPTSLEAYGTPGDISIKGGDFCNAGMVREAETRIDQLFFEANRVAERVQQCSAACAPRINTAEFCAYGHQLAVDNILMSRTADSAVTAALMYDEASSSNQLVLTILSRQLTQLSGEVSTLLDQAASAVEKAVAGSPSVLPDETRWNLAARDLANFAKMLALLQSVGLASGDIEGIASKIDMARTTLEDERNALHKAAEGAEVLTPAEAGRLLTAFEAAKTGLLSTVANVASSKQKAVSQAERAINTDATALPAASSFAVSYQAASACFTKMSLALMTGREAVIESKRALNECRSFDECRILPIPNRLSVGDFARRADEAAKLSASITASMCEQP